MHSKLIKADTVFARSNAVQTIIVSRRKRVASTAKTIAVLRECVSVLGNEYKTGNFRSLLNLVDD